MAEKLVCAASGMEDGPLPWQVERKIIEIPAIEKEVSIIGSSIPEWAVA